MRIYKKDYYMKVIQNENNRIDDKLLFCLQTKVVV